MSKMFATALISRELVGNSTGVRYKAKKILGHVNYIK